MHVLKSIAVVQLQDLTFKKLTICDSAFMSILKFPFAHQTIRMTISAPILDLTNPENTAQAIFKTTLDLKTNMLQVLICNEINQTV